MDDGERKRRERVLHRLPVVRVRTRREMARLLSKYRWLLDAIAEQKLGDTPEAGETVDATVAEMLKPDQADLPHALRTVTHALHQACYQVLKERARPLSNAEKAWANGQAYDPVLRRWTKRLAAAVADLPPAQRTVFELVSKGVTVQEIATALDAKPKTVAMNLYRARQRLRPFARKGAAGLSAGALGVRWAWNRVTGAATGARLTAMRWGTALDGSCRVPSQLANAAALATIVAWALSPVAPAVPSRALGSSRSDVVSEASRTASSSTPSSSPTLQVANHANPIGAALPNLIAAAPERLHRPNSPSETRLVSATPAPDYQTNHTIVALGQAPDCACSVLFESADGGHSWAAAPGPPTGTEIALPPDYPRDPRIFIGSSAQLVGGSDYVSDHFGGTYTPLGGGPGLLALSGAFDAGDPTVYLASQAGLTAIDMSTGVPSAPVVATGIWGLVTLAPRPDGPGVLVVVPPGSVVPGTGTDLAGAGGFADSVLLRCSRGACIRVSDVGTGSVQALVISSTYGADHALLTSTARQLAISTTEGASFVPVSLPPGAQAVGSVAIAAGRIWAVTGDVGGGTRLSWVPTEGGVWHTLASSDLVLRSRGVLVAAGADHLLYLVHDQGFRCSGDVGRSWSSGCPSS